MRALASFTLAAAIFASAAGSAAAAIVVPIDQSVRLSIPGSAYSVLVGSPGVADVTVVDSQTLYVSGHNYGTTDVVVLDRAGQTLYRGDILVTSPDNGRVSIYRGSSRTDLACAPGCQVAVRAGGAVAAAGGGAPAPSAPPAPATP